VFRLESLVRALPELCGGGGSGGAECVAHAGRGRTAGSQQADLPGLMLSGLKPGEGKP
jgi:hypothetical protein